VQDTVAIASIAAYLTLIILLDKYYYLFCLQEKETETEFSPRPLRMLTVCPIAYLPNLTSYLSPSVSDFLSCDEIRPSTYVCPTVPKKSGCPHMGKENRSNCQCLLICSQPVEPIKGFKQIFTR
jgi:hypothetical protein